MKKGIVFSVCFLAFAFTGSRQESRIIGRWTEHWGKDSINPETDVDYVDTITISNVAGKLNINCHHDSSYVYDKIKVKGDSVYFRMKNMGSSSDDEPFYVNFMLKQTANDRMEGRIFNSNNETVSMTLKKLPVQ